MPSGHHHTTKGLAHANGADVGRRAGVLTGLRTETESHSGGLLTKTLDPLEKAAAKLGGLVDEPEPLASKFYKQGYDAARQRFLGRQKVKVASRPPRPELHTFKRSRAITPSRRKAPSPAVPTTPSDQHKVARYTEALGAVPGLGLVAAPVAGAAEAPDGQRFSRFVDVASGSAAGQLGGGLLGGALGTLVGLEALRHRAPGSGAVRDALMRQHVIAGLMGGGALGSSLGGLAGSGVMNRERVTPFKHY